MYRLVYSPQWFYDIEIIIELFVIIMLGVLAWYLYRMSKVCSGKKMQWLSIAFAILGVGSFLKLGTNFTLYHLAPRVYEFGNLTVTFTKLHTVHIPFLTGFFLYHITTLAGLLMLVILYNKSTKTQTFLMSYFILITALFSYVFISIFHLTAAMLFLAVYAGISHQKHYNKQLASCFVLLSLSHLVFAGLQAHSFLYVIAESIYLIAFILLLITFIQVKNAKTKQKGHSS